jgi:hypothetical protein
VGDSTSGGSGKSEPGVEVDAGGVGSSDLGDLRLDLLALELNLLNNRVQGERGSKEGGRHDDGYGRGEGEGERRGERVR